MLKIRVKLEVSLKFFHVCLLLMSCHDKSFYVNAIYMLSCVLYLSLLEENFESFPSPPPIYP